MANNKMTICKSCGKEIASSAYTCPHCGAKNKMSFLGALFCIAGIYIIIEIISGMVSPKKDITVGVGERAESNGVAITLTRAYDEEQTPYHMPDEGYAWVICEFEIENNSKHEIEVYESLCFESYCDSYAVDTKAILTHDLNGSIDAGKKMKGVLGYEIPEDWQELEIKFTPYSHDGNTIKFTVNKQ